MWNVLVGYLFARSVVGERAAKRGFLIVMICIIFVLLALALSFFDIFSSSKKHLSASVRRTMANRSLKNHAAFEAGNCAAAETILVDLAKYDGEGALVVLWARRVLQGGQPGCESQSARRPRGCRPERAEGGGMDCL